MAKKAHSTIRQVNIADIVKTARSTQPGPDIYSNHVVATINANELVVDFYQLAPKRGDPSEQPVAEHRQRIVLPHSIIPGLKNLFSSMNDGLLELAMLQKSELEADNGDHSENG